MFLVDSKNKTTEKVKEITFKEIGLKERKDLQEWISNNPNILGEDLLIIQKEFDGFNNTNERLDLLALDKDGNLVIIENKLDDSGKDVVWQALKYAGYCSSLTKEAIRSIFQQYLIKIGNTENTEKIITDFLNKPDFSEVQLNQDLSQRIILVAKEFRKEVTNTVIWARKFGIKIQCIKVIPFMAGEQLIIDTDQIIPVKDIEDIMISYDEKSLENIKTKEELANCQIYRNEFWHKLLPYFNTKSDLFSGRNMELNQYDHWLSAGSGISGCPYSFVVTKNYCSVEFSISNSEKEFNKKVYDYFYNLKDEIEETFGNKLYWEKLEDKKMSRISYRLNDVSIFHREDWDNMITFLTENMIKFDRTFKKHINNFKKEDK